MRRGRGRRRCPWKVKELMLVLQIEVNRRYKPYVPPEKTQDQDNSGTPDWSEEIIPRMGAP